MVIKPETIPLEELKDKEVIKETSKKAIYFINNKFIVGDKGLNSLSNIFETVEYNLALDNYGQRFEATQLNLGLLYLIVTVQNYKNLVISKNHLEEVTQTGKKGKRDYYEECKSFYNSFDNLMMEELGLKKNNIDFEKVLYYDLTNEIRSSDFDDLGKFSF